MLVGQRAHDYRLTVVVPSLAHLTGISQTAPAQGLYLAGKKSMVGVLCTCGQLLDSEDKVGARGMVLV